MIGVIIALLLADEETKYCSKKCKKDENYDECYNKCIYELLVYFGLNDDKNKNEKELLEKIIQARQKIQNSQDLRYNESLKEKFKEKIQRQILKRKDIEPNI